MPLKIKQRLAGILVVLSLVLVIWPLVSGNPWDKNQDEEFIQPPPVPEIKPIDVPDGFGEGDQQQLLKSFEQPELRPRSSGSGTGKNTGKSLSVKGKQEKSAAPASSGRKQPAARSKGPTRQSQASQQAAKKYRVRVGIFASPALTEQRLQDIGYRSRSENWHSPTKGDHLFAVYIDRRLTEKQAQKLKRKVDRQLNVNSIVEEIAR